MLTTMTRDIVVIARETRKKEGHVDDQQRDGHLSTRIPLFSSRNNRLVLARPTRRFRRRVIKREKRSGRLGDGWLQLGAKGRRTFFVFTSAKKERKSRNQDADNPRPKDEDYDARGEGNVTNNMKFWRLPESLNTLGIIVERKRKRKGEKKVIPEGC